MKNETGSLRVTIADLVAASSKKLKEIKKAAGKGSPEVTKLVTRLPKEERPAQAKASKDDPATVVVELGEDARGQQCLVVKKPFVWGFDKTFLFHTVMGGDNQNKRWLRKNVGNKANPNWLMYVPLEDLPLLMKGLHEHFDGKVIQVGDERIVGNRAEATK